MGWEEEYDWNAIYVDMDTGSETTFVYENEEFWVLVLSKKESKTDNKTKE